MSHNKKLPEPEEVERLYWEEGMTTYEIAEEFGLYDGSPVSQYMSNHSIKTRNPGSLRGENHPKYVEPEELLDDVIAGYVFLGYWPKSDDYKDFGQYTNVTARKKFGSWPETVEAAKERYEENKDEWPEVNHD